MTLRQRTEERREAAAFASRAASCVPPPSLVAWCEFPRPVRTCTSVHVETGLVPRLRAVPLPACPGAAPLHDRVVHPTGRAWYDPRRERQALAACSHHLSKMLHPPPFRDRVTRLRPMHPRLARGATLDTLHRRVQGTPFDVFLFPVSCTPHTDHLPPLVPPILPEVHRVGTAHQR